jgi:ATP-dependent exoDNAse (exonuclease V) beta subunit
MRRRREDGARQVEGRPDSGSDAVSIVTMHSAKGLEWPVVVPINMATVIQERTGPIAAEGGLLLNLLGQKVPGYEEANAAENNERARERARLLYVADTRARDLLVLPRHSVEGTRQSWSKVCKSRLADLLAFDQSVFEAELPDRVKPPECPQDEATFAADSARIATVHKVIKRRTPSSHEVGYEPVVSTEVIALDEEIIEQTVVKGSPARGTILHKLIEEVLTGETDEQNVAARARVLSGEFGTAEAVEPKEMATTIARTLALPEIAALRARLVAEVDLAGFLESEGENELTIGIADAVAVTETGAIDIVVDWKSDVEPDAATLSGYRRQMSDYLLATRAGRGLIVLMTSGRILEVQATASPGKGAAS